MKDRKFFAVTVPPDSLKRVKVDDGFNGNCAKCGDRVFESLIFFEHKVRKDCPHRVRV